jgi:hypothetical protein
MMQNDILCVQAERDRRRWARPVLQLLGGVLYIAIALVVMQFAFRLWAGMW